MSDRELADKMAAYLEEQDRKHKPIAGHEGQVHKYALPGETRRDVRPQGTMQQRLMTQEDMALRAMENLLRLAGNLIQAEKSLLNDSHKLSREETEKTKKNIAARYNGLFEIWNMNEHRVRPYLVHGDQMAAKRLEADIGKFKPDAHKTTQKRQGMDVVEWLKPLIKDGWTPALLPKAPKVQAVATGAAGVPAKK